MKTPPSPASPPASQSSRPNGRLAVASALFVTLLAAAGYWWTGTPGVAGRPGAAPPAGFAAADGAAPSASGAHDGSDAGELGVLVERLAERLKERPDDAAGFAMLGRSYLVMGRYDEAAQAYGRALKLAPDETTVILGYAEAMAMKNGSNLAGEPTQLIERALKIDPNSLNALSLAGAAAFQRGDFATAVARWDRVVALGSPDDPVVQQARDGIAQARADGKLAPAATTAAATAAVPALPPAAGAAPAAAATAAANTVSGTVTLAAAVRARAAPDDIVFIFARAAEGSRMPLALLRKQVKDLPATFTLDDSLSMSPAAKLSTTPRVIVGARLSKSGQAMPQPGDFEGLSAPVAVGTGGLKIEIAAPVK